MIRLRSFAASAGQVRGCRFAAAARQSLTTTAFVLIGGGASVLACPQCFGAQDNLLIDGAKLGVLVMVGITLAVQGAFVAFFFYLRKRAKRMADSDLESEWLALQRGSRTS
jgi:heme/copper-type cytochrome/quinol oxidase subunit 2